MIKNKYKDQTFRSELEFNFKRYLKVANSSTIKSTSKLVQFGLFNKALKIIDFRNKNMFTLVILQNMALQICMEYA